MRSLLVSMGALALAALAAGCSDDDDVFTPSVENVSGSYSAETFTVTTGAGTVDLLAQGAEVTVDLAADGTTTGHLFIPGGDEDGGDLEADLSGSWTLTDSTVTFSQDADTFIRDVEFTASENRLTTEGAFGEATIRLVLGRTE
jgi:hypothetical protein